MKAYLKAANASFLRALERCFFEQLQYKSDVKRSSETIKLYKDSADTYGSIPRK